MSTTSTLSRRTLVASAAALPALAVPTVASAAPARAIAASTTLPPDLIERFVRMRAWYLDYSRREKLSSDETGRRFYAATGVTNEQYYDMNYGDRGERRLRAVHKKIYAEVTHNKDEDECDDLCTSDGRSPKPS